MQIIDTIKRKLHTFMHTERLLTKKVEGSFIYPLLPDKIALDLLFYNVFGRRVNWTNPKTFNEKLQWLKLYNRNPLYTKLVDKYEVKKWVAEKIGSQYIIPTYGVWNSFDEIDFSELPDKFVLKTTHGGGNTGVVICKDKNSFEKNAAREKLTASLKTDTYIIGREWPYKYVPKRIIAEKFIKSEGNDLLDYKFMCFNGKVKCLFVCTERNAGNLKITFFDYDWNVMPFERDHPKSTKPIPKPHCYDEMIFIAEKLSAGFPFVRVDLYEVPNNISNKYEVFFGELTFFPGGGTEKFQPEEWDYKLGELISLPR